MARPDFELAKWHNKWAVYMPNCRAFTFIGKGKKFCKKKVEELNNGTD